MKIISFSDTHGELPDIGEFDLMLIAGDVSPGGSFPNQKKWWLNEFYDWFKHLTLKDNSRILITPGNHDCRQLFNSSKFLKEIESRFSTYVKFLIDEKFIYEYYDGEELKTLTIYGTPWCTKFGNWDFMGDDSWLESVFREIPENLDILLTHDAPYGCSDICYEGWNMGKHIGNKPLREAIIQKKPKYCVHGHLHTSNHEPMFLNGTRVINVALLNEQYEVSYKPLILNEYNLNCTINEELNDDELIFPNRSGRLVRLRKTGIDWTLDLDDYLYYTRVGYNDDGIQYIDPDSGPMLMVGAKWFGYKIEAIREIDNNYIFTLSKCTD